MLTFLKHKLRLKSKIFYYSWISHGADASERYRSFARPAVFSHDRLTFTMANHLEEQKSPLTCKLLVAELERIITEETEQRKVLFKDGVREVSEYITLPPNRVDQLDEDSANYDDKRLCHACKHICFFSCVACECSRSKVSCLRHSHFMCRCPTERRYMMIWSTEKEMEETLANTKAHLKKLESSHIDLKGADNETVKETQDKNDDNGNLTEAPGVAEDNMHHKGNVIDASPSSAMFRLPETGERLSSVLKSNIQDSGKDKDTVSTM